MKKEATAQPRISFVEKARITTLYYMHLTLNFIGNILITCGYFCHEYLPRMVDAISNKRRQITRILISIILILGFIGIVCLTTAPDYDESLDGKVATVLVTRLNIYSEPEGKVVGSCPSGTKVCLTGFVKEFDEIGEWIEIWYGNSRVWVQEGGITNLR